MKIHFNKGWHIQLSCDRLIEVVCITEIGKIYMIDAQINNQKIL